ncbi:hypothetical protein B0H16DRAFT_1812659 [Mycena metata]|uniref:Uncharacterized protein n=1 Tax=Mycena metata TaxID=1033252 RepID=A0AAD7JB42_9AGAR|nr:hypothetical protein B0H16DRAFT_1812659 [Mycena metata]
MAPRWFTKAYYAWSGHAVPTVINLQPHVRLVQIDAPDAKRFADACRAHGATVTSALYTLLICALSRLIATNNASYRTLSVGTNVSLRGAATPTPTPSSALCNHVSSYHTYPPLNTEFSWSDAARFAVELKAQRLKAREAFGLMALASNHYTSIMLDTEGEKGKAQWSMGNMFFVYNDSFSGPALGLNVLGDPAGGINICTVLSTAAFHCSLLRALQNASSSSTFSSSVVVPDLPLLPPIEDLTDTSVSLWTLFGFIYEAMAPRWFTKAYYAWSGHAVPTVIKLQPHVRLVQIDPLDAKRFADTCRAHGATVTSALYTLLICALSRLLAANNASYRSLSVSTPVSLRGVATPTPTPSSALCNHVSSCHTYPPLNTEFSWSDAARFAIELKAQRLMVRETFGLLALVSNRYTGIIRGELGQKRQFGLTLSNLGRIKVDTEGEKGSAQWSMGNMFFVHEDTFAGPALGLNVLGDPGGGINICVKWGEESLDSGHSSPPFPASARFACAPRSPSRRRAARSLTYDVRIGACSTTRGDLRPAMNQLAPFEAIYLKRPLSFIAIELAGHIKFLC